MIKNKYRRDDAHDGAAAAPGSITGLALSAALAIAAAGCGSGIDGRAGLGPGPDLAGAADGERAGPGWGAEPRGKIVPGPPEDDPSMRCVPLAHCPHKGGDAHHNWCADAEPPNSYPGCDVRVSGKYFDAITAQDVLWEVKTERWSEYTPWLRDVIAQRFAAEARLEQRVAGFCEFPFVFGVSDAGLYNELRKDIADILRHIPRCVRP